MADYCSVALRGLPEAVRAVTVGSNLRVFIYIVGDDLLPVEPTEVTLRVQSPAEEAEEQTWTLDGAGDSEELTVGTTGNWYADLTLDAAGVWLFRAVASGSHADADERRITVPASAFAA